MRNLSYCEMAFPDDFLRSKADSISNAAFVAAGVIVLAFGAADAVWSQGVFSCLCSSQRYHYHNNRAGLPRGVPRGRHGQIEGVNGAAAPVVVKVVACARRRGGARRACCSWMPCRCLTRRVIEPQQQLTTGPNLLLGPGGPWISFFIGVSFVWVGASSFIFHASMTRIGQFLDVGGFTSALFSCVFYAVVRVFPHFCGSRIASSAAFSRCLVALVCLVSVAMLPAGYFIRMSGLIKSFETLAYSIGLLTALTSIHFFLWPAARCCLPLKARRTSSRARAYSNVALALGKKDRDRGPPLAVGMDVAGFLLGPASLAVAYLGFTFRQRDFVLHRGKYKPKAPDCDPFSFFQWHSMWHVMEALALLLLYLLFRSEVRYQVLLAPDRGDAEEEEEEAEDVNQDGNPAPAADDDNHDDGDGAGGARGAADAVGEGETTDAPPNRDAGIQMTALTIEEVTVTEQTV